MKQLLPFFTLLLLFTSFKTKDGYFSGKISYHFQFTDLEGNDMTQELIPYYGASHDYYIDGRNYKSYTGQKLRQLYFAETNTHYGVMNDTVEITDGSTRSSLRFMVKLLSQTENIAGYECNILRVWTDYAETDYYFSPLIRVDSEAFAKHIFGEWGQMLIATEGALPLKIVTRHEPSGVIWTSTATEITPMKLTSQDFVPPANMPIREEE